jgi:RHS repeat-associated protein
LDGTVDIPEGAASPVLSYYSLFDYDDAVFLVDITTDDRQSWTNIYFEEGWEPDWEQNVISLDGYQGETISVRFRVVGGEELFETWQIDDVRIGEEEGAYTLPGRKAVFKLIGAPLLQSEMVTVTVEDTDGASQVGLPVYVFDGDTYLSLNGTTDELGRVDFNLLPGSYRFRADYDNVQFWSGDVDHCTIPGCLEALVEIPGGVGEVSVTIDYEYDPLYRLTAADYSSDEYFQYTYDAVGNRLTQETHLGTNTYTYDIANHVIEVDGVLFIWDANGNLLDDGVSTYTYDHANRLTSVVQGSDTYTFAYNGLGDRLQQTVNGIPTNYTLDLNAGMTQVLEDGTNAYLYGLRRIGEEKPDGWQVYLGDALGSVRQLSDTDAAVTLTRSYKPYGDLSKSIGNVSSIYGFTNEQFDGTGLIFLRARHYAPWIGVFTGRDEWPGHITNPATLHRYNYVAGNPVNHVDPSGAQFLIFDPFILTLQAQEAVSLFKVYYSKAGPLRFCAFERPHGHSPDEMTVDDLLTDFICETGAEHIHFGPNAHLTQQLARTGFIGGLRERFSWGHGQPLSGRWYFENMDFLMATLESIKEGDPVRLDFGFTVQLNIVHFLGTFDYDVRLEDGWVRFEINNATSLKSGTRILTAYGGAHPSLEGIAKSIEGLVEGNAWLGFETVAYLVDTYPVISILEEQTRGETRGLFNLQGGGTTTQTFLWRDPPDFLCDPSQYLVDSIRESELH